MTKSLYTWGAACVAATALGGTYAHYQIQGNSAAAITVAQPDIADQPTFGGDPTSLGTPGKAIPGRQPLNHSCQLDSSQTPRYQPERSVDRPARPHYLHAHRDGDASITDPVLKICRPGETPAEHASPETTGPGPTGRADEKHHATTRPQPGHHIDAPPSTVPPAPQSAARHAADRLFSRLNNAGLVSSGLGYADELARVVRIELGPVSGLDHDDHVAEVLKITKPALETEQALDGYSLDVRVGVEYTVAPALPAQSGIATSEQR